MSKGKSLALVRVAVIISGLIGSTNLAPAQTATGSSDGISGAGQMRSTTMAQRQAARSRQARPRNGVRAKIAGVNPRKAAMSPLAAGANLATMAPPLSMPDYFGVANWANSPLPAVDSTGAITGGIRKFVNTLPGFCGISTWGTSGVNELNQCIPVAAPDTTTFSGSDYYRIQLSEYSRKMHTDLPATRLRGYVQVDSNGNLLTGPDTTQQYLGPFILATRKRPVRILFENKITTNLPLPVDTTYMGAGIVSDGTRSKAASQKRAVIHLHGGNTPWISDGTPHQWITPAGADGQPLFSGFAKGFGFQNVPDMVGSGKPIPAPTLADGKATYYYTNDQSGRLLWYHDHVYGLTRLNVYAGEAAGYLLVDPAQETSLKTATVPGTILNPATPGDPLNDLAHIVPLVIQDKTFVPDSGVAGGQLAATDPTWDVANYGGAGSLWFPHVYMPNQNPADNSGANPFGRWDYGPWFWPPQNSSTYVPQGQPKPCTSPAYPGVALTCPGTPNPSGTPEAFMDTAVVNGTAYPKMTVDPTAYRFHILNAGNDRALNLGLYIAEPLTIAVTNGGSGYSSAPAVSFDSGTAAATAMISTGSITGVAVSAGGTGYTAAPTVTFTGGGGSGASAIALLRGDTVSGIVIVNSGTGYTSAPVVNIAGGGGNGVVATAEMTPAGQVIAIQVTDPGSYTTAPKVTLTGGGGTGATAIASVNTEIKMVDAVPHSAASALPRCSVATESGMGGLGIASVSSGIPLNGTGLPTACWPTSWPTDGRDGGVPDPASAGPPIIQIGTEGGLLPKAVVIPSTPMVYEYNRRSITVLNIFTHGLLLGPAERADIIIDFKAFAGKTLILYNDAPAPVPAFDPRVDYYTGDPDQSDSGGAPTTLPGYGPNTRTLLQIQVGPTGSPSNFNLLSVQTALPDIFAGTQDQIIVAQPDYPAANGGSATNTFVRIQDTSAAIFNGSLGGITLTQAGSGYLTAPTVDIQGGGTAATGAKATATLQTRGVASLTRVNAGANYTSVPVVTIVPAAGDAGTGATATAVMAPTTVSTITVQSGGQGYRSTPIVTITGGGGTGATATATVANNRITAVTVTNHGSGYTSAPTVSFSGGGGLLARASAVLAPTTVANFVVTNQGAGYASTPSVTITGGGGSGASATAVLPGAGVASITLTNAGTGYLSAPTVTIIPATGDPGLGATAIATAPVMQILPKTIQELFTLDYGRMNATLGVELPFTNFLTQTTIPYGFVDPPTELFKDGDTQLWKITHNGVDTHFLHFHLVTVQVLNRVGWDGAIKPPDPNELSWKDTLRMNPLEDIIVALRAVKPNVPWELPNSVRPLDVTQPVGTSMANQFTNVDPTNQPATVTNAMTNFGWEYIWHCHILGHEENDMMRAMAMAVAPIAPSGLTGAVNVNNSRVVLTWADNSINETGFTVQRATSILGPWTNRATLPAGRVTYTDTVARNTTYQYRVVANNVVGYTQTYAAPAAGYGSMSADSPSAVATVVTH